ncbi:caspase family protein [Tenacibaculum xiamenense]|uniref:caspase family protein n=1 Tax=Tenacibaculum xiamenense TaxID=1261553 RepID=UPI0038958565
MGVKKVLCIGIDKYHPQVTTDELKGCKNDVQLWQKLLGEQFGFQVEEPIYDDYATSEVIEKRMKSFLRSLNKEDLGVIFFSGHGSRKYREGNCYETICAYESRIEGTSSLRSWIDTCKKKEARLVFIVDACESGTLTDLGRFGELIGITELDQCCFYAIYGSYVNKILQEDGVFQINLHNKNENAQFEEFLKMKDLKMDFDFTVESATDYLAANHKSVDRVHLKYRLDNLSRESYSLEDVIKLTTTNRKVRYHAFEDSCNPYQGSNNNIIINTKDEYEILITACRGKENAYEDYFDSHNQINGVFTHLVMEVLKEGVDISYNELCALLKEKLRTDYNYAQYNQTPLLQGNDSFKSQKIFSI